MAKVEVKKLNKSYYIGKEEYKVLKDLDISFNYGEFVAVYGESGSGKSTFMNVLGGLDEYDSGEILIDGENISKFTSKSMDYYRNRKIGFIFQEFKLLENLTLLENVMMPLNIAGVSTSKAKKRAIKLLTQVGLKDHIKKRARNLSGGQKQRVAIARALANDPEIILADEPTGALDSKTTIEILELLKSIADSGKLVISITHSEEVAKYGNRVVTLDDGKFTEETAPSVDVEKNSDKIATKRETSKLSILKAFKIARRNLFSKKARTYLVALGVSLGITGALVITSISESATSQLNKTFSGFEYAEGAVGVGIMEKSNDFVSVNLELTKSRDEEIATLESFGEQYEGFEKVNPEYIVLGFPVETTPELPTEEELEEGFMGTYIAHVAYVDYNQDNMSMGSYPKNEREVIFSGDANAISYLLSNIGKDSKQKELSEIVDGIDFSKKNDKYYELVDFVEENIIGSTYDAYIDGEVVSFKITGSLELTQMSLHNTALILPDELNEDFIKEIENDTVVYIYYMQFDSDENAEILMDDLGTTGSLSASDTYDITAQDYRILMQTIDYVLSIIRNVFLVLMSVSLVVSLFMVNIIVYISTLERKVEIGTLRAIGAKKNNITSIFVGEGIWLGFFAFILSIIGSYILITIVNAVFYFVLKMPTFNTIIFSVKWLFIIGALVTFVMFIASLLPAMKASRQNPIDALREE